MPIIEMRIKHTEESKKIWLETVLPLIEKKQ